MKILLATDFSEASVNALRYCLALSGRERLHIYVAHVYRHGAHPHLTAAQLEQFYEQEYAAFQARTRRFGQVYPNLMETQVVLRCALEVTVTEGDASRALSEMAYKHRVDLLVIGSKEHPGLLRRLFGPLSRALIRDPQTPLLIIPETYTAGIPSQIDLLVVSPEDEPLMQEWLRAAGIFSGVDTMTWLLDAADQAVVDKVPGQDTSRRRISSRSFSDICAQLRTSKPELAAVIFREDAGDADTRYRDQLIHYLYDHLGLPLLCLHA